MFFASISPLVASSLNLHPEGGNIFSVVPILPCHAMSSHVLPKSPKNTFFFENSSSIRASLTLQFPKKYGGLACMVTRTVAAGIHGSNSSVSHSTIEPVLHPVVVVNLSVVNTDTMEILR
jgi:hypothetical protein